jgi:hypothetical protein
MIQKFLGYLGIFMDANLRLIIRLSAIITRKTRYWQYLQKRVNLVAFRRLDQVVVC